MQFVSEDVVNQVLDKFDDDSTYLEHFKEIMINVPELTEYINPESYTLLTVEEFSLLEYLTCVLYHSVKTHLNTPPVIVAKTLEDYEEKNWEVFNSAGKKNFSNVLDTFFNGYPQEDLLALVEDAITADSDTPITIVGAEIVFVACKTMIDTMNELN